MAVTLRLDEAETEAHRKTAGREIDRGTVTVTIIRVAHRADWCRLGAHPYGVDR